MKTILGIVDDASDCLQIARLCPSHVQRSVACSQFPALAKNILIDLPTRVSRLARADPRGFWVSHFKYLRYWRQLCWKGDDGIALIAKPYSFHKPGCTVGYWWNRSSAAMRDLSRN